MTSTLTSPPHGSTCPFDWCRPRAATARPFASRAFGYAGLTLYEALVPGITEYRSLGGVLGDLEPLPAARKNKAYDWPTVANAALAAIFRDLFATTDADNLAAVDVLEASFNDRFGVGLPQDVFKRSLRRGSAVAAALFDYSKSDGGHEAYLNSFPPYAPPVGPGLWTPTPPGFLPALQPYWGRNRGFALADGSECSPGAHPLYSEDPSSAFYAEGFEVCQTVNNRTPEQEATALYWADDPATSPTPAGHSISIATQVLRGERASLATAAVVYAMVGMAVADAFVACWFQKYRYNLVRPVTYIQRLIDPDWLPILVTPPFPEYTSGHSVQSGPPSRFSPTCTGTNTTSSTTLTTTAACLLAASARSSRRQRRRPFPAFTAASTTGPPSPTGSRRGGASDGR